MSRARAWSRRVERDGRSNEVGAQLRRHPLDRAGMHMESQLQLGQRMMTGLRSYRAMGKWSLVVRLAALGAFAGFAAWTVVFVAHLLFDVGRPSGIALLLAIPRGAIFGVVLALILRVYWNRPRGQDEPKERL